MFNLRAFNDFWFNFAPESEARDGGKDGFGIGERVGGAARFGAGDGIEFSGVSGGKIAYAALGQRDSFLALDSVVEIFLLGLRDGFGILDEGSEKILLRVSDRFSLEDFRALRVVFERGMLRDRFGVFDFPGGGLKGGVSDSVALEDSIGDLARFREIFSDFISFVDRVDSELRFLEKLRDRFAISDSSFFVSMDSDGISDFVSFVGIGEVFGERVQIFGANPGMENFPVFEWDFEDRIMGFGTIGEIQVVASESGFWVMGEDAGEQFEAKIKTGVVSLGVEDGGDPLGVKQPISAYLFLSSDGEYFLTVRANRKGEWREMTFKGRKIEFSRDEIPLSSALRGNVFQFELVSENPIEIEAIEVYSVYLKRGI